jgi:predicted nucleotidyltransferase
MVVTKTGDPLVAQQARESLAPLTAELRQRLGSRLVALVLFGSRARGDAADGSDWDVLLISAHLPPKPFERHLYVKQLLPTSWRSSVSVLAKTPEEFDAALQVVYLDIALDGVVLYDRQRYVTKRLSKIRRHLATQGLYRAREGQNFHWRWRHAPPSDWSFQWEDVGA